MSRTTTSRRQIVRTLAAAAALAVVPAVASSAPAQAAYCGITWGSLAKASSTMVTRPITNVRAGRHACFDRLVVDPLVDRLVLAELAAKRPCPRFTMLVPEPPHMRGNLACGKDRGHGDARPDDALGHPTRPTGHRA